MAASRDSKKGLSVRHENFIAKLFGGRRSKSSGASVTDKGDVRTEHLLFECKMTETKKPTYVKQFEKIAQEAYEDGRTPMLALRFYDPGSLLADANGWIDLVMMLAGDAAERQEAFIDAQV